MEIENTQKNDKIYKNYIEKFTLFDKYEDDDHIMSFYKLDQYIKAISLEEREMIIKKICSDFQLFLKDNKDIKIDEIEKTNTNIIIRHPYLKEYSSFLRSIIFLDKNIDTRNDLFFLAVNEIKRLKYNLFITICNFDFFCINISHLKVQQNTHYIYEIIRCFDFTPDEEIKFSNALLVEQFKYFFKHYSFYFSWDLGVANKTCYTNALKRPVLFYNSLNKKILQKNMVGYSS